MPFDFYSEYDSPATIEAIANALRVGGHTVHFVEADDRLPQWFLTHSVDLAFNIAEGTHGAHRESFVPAILESLGVPFTGSSSVTTALAMDKAKTKQVLAYEGVPTPEWQLFESAEEHLLPHLEFPLIVKPNCEGSAKGIMRESVVHSEGELRRQLARVLGQYDQPALVEEFIDGVELTVGVLGNNPLRALPILEIDFSGCQHSGEFFYSWRMKEYQGDEALGLDPVFHCPARLSPALTTCVHDMALRAHRALNCWDVSRTDIRLHKDGTPFVLEVNPLPGLDPLESNLPIMTHAAGISHAELINRLVELAIERVRAGRHLHRHGAYNAHPQESSAHASADAVASMRVGLR